MRPSTVAPRARAAVCDSSTRKVAPSPRTASSPRASSISATSGSSSSTPPASTAATRPPATAAAPRATASSPATVGTLSVSDSSRAATAIAVVAAIVFITVLGNNSAERPAAPRARKPSAKAMVEVKSPSSLPTTRPRPRAGSRPASATASRAAAMVSWHTRESRRASLGSMRAVSVASGSRAAGRPWPTATRAAARGWASHAPSAGEAPTTAALTTPTPVTTTVFLSTTSNAPEEERDVLAAEAEGVGDGALDRRLARHARHAVERHLGVGRHQRGRGWDQLVGQRQDRGDRFQRAGGRPGVPDHPLGRANQRPTLAEHARDGARLDTVVLRRGRAVPVDVAHPRRAPARPGPRPAHRAGHPLALRLGRGPGERVRRPPLPGPLRR